MATPCSWSRSRARGRTASRGRWRTSASSPSARSAATRSRCSRASRKARRWSPPASSSCATGPPSSSTTPCSLRTRRRPGRKTSERTAMKFTDIFVRRPVLATVVSLLLLVLGLRSVTLLPVLQFPRTQNAVVTVTTVYTGADPALVSGFITTPLENSIAQAGGIDYLTSSSTEGLSTIQANLRLNYDPNKALTEINTKVNAVLNQLPKESQLPVITVAIGETIDSMYIGFYSNVLPTNKITDYLIRVVQPKLQAVEGVQQAEILGEKRFA